MPPPPHYLKNATAGLLLIVPLVLAVVMVAAVQQGRPGQPAMIVLSEAEGYTFPSGSAVVSKAFARRIDETIAPLLRRQADGCACDVVEVVGHTDGQLVGGRSNLDQGLGRAVDGGAALTPLTPGSNADLGLMRAWAVAALLQRHPATRHLTFHGLSAAQMIEPSGAHARPDDFGDRPERRRIEIRLRRRDGEGSGLR